MERARIEREPMVSAGNERDWFVVHAHHNTGHDEESDVILLTEDIRQAVETARKAETLGFQFYGETYVLVTLCRPGAVYGKEERAGQEIFLRRHYRHRTTGWQERWGNEDWKRRFEEAA